MLCSTTIAASIAPSERSVVEQVGGAAALRLGHPRGGFIEQEQRRPGEKDHPDLQALLLAVTEFAGAPICGTALKLDQFDALLSHLAFDRRRRAVRVESLGRAPSSRFSSTVSPSKTEMI